MRSIYERISQKTLESQGYVVDWKVRPRFGGRGYKTDLLGLFDLVAVRGDMAVRWISVKGVETSLKQHRQELKDFVFPENNQKELWRYTKGKKFPPKIEIL